MKQEKQSQIKKKKKNIFIISIVMKKFLIFAQKIQEKEQKLKEKK